MSLSILGLGTALPPDRVSQEDALAMSSELICEDARQKRVLQMLFERSGVSNRNTVIPWQIGYEWKYGEESSPSGQGPSTGKRMKIYASEAFPLAREASSKALKDASLEPDQITHLVTVSCTGFEAPGWDIELIKSLGLRPTTERVHVGFMGCHGSINGLRVAKGLAASDPEAHILLCAVELCSLHYRMTWELEGIIGNALFADGAAAVVCSGQSDPPRELWNLLGTGSFLLPDSEEEMSWKIGDHGFEMRLTSRVPVLIKRHLQNWLPGWLEGLNQSVKSIAAWAVHPGGPKILDAVESSLQLSSDACSVSREVLDECGNMSSPTVIFILDRLRASEQVGPVVVLGFGPGLVAEVALLG